MSEPISKRDRGTSVTCVSGADAARLDVAIDRNTDVTHKIAAKFTMLGLAMRPFLTAMFEKSKTFEAESSRRQSLCPARSLSNASR